MKQPDDDPSLHAAVIASAIIAVAIIAFASLADEGAESLTAWVDRYQTLITGVLAVGAALATVWQMQASDAEQERRHQQDRYDARRGEIVAVKRLRAYLPRAVEDAMIDLRPYVDPAQSQNPFGDAVNWVRAMMAVEAVQSALQDYRVASCYPFFAAGVFEVLESCKLDAEILVKMARAREGLTLAESELDKDSFYMAVAAQRLTTLNTNAEKLSRLVVQWADDHLADIDRLHDGPLTPLPNRS